MTRCLVVVAFAASLAGAPVTLKINGKVVPLPLEHYVAGVLAGESSVFRSGEALKAMAVAARTYAVRLRGRHSSEGFDFCASTHCQRVDLGAVTARLERAAAETAGELLWFEGNPAFACYTRDCGGRTENAGEIWPDMSAPYLKSHDDPYCVRSGGNSWEWATRPHDILEALSRSGLRSPRVLESIYINQTTASGRAHILLLGDSGAGISISATSFRFAIGRAIGWDTLRSDLYKVQFTNGRYVFQGVGAGHGAGLCQRGADRMGVEGATYREILKFYYPGTSVGLTARGFKWVRLGGESVAIFTTEPDRDSSLLRKAEQLGRALSARTHLPLPPNTEIRVYPDIETFRNATAEPGWVAARTSGARIELQPVSILQRQGALDTTLRHELLHVLIESNARPGLPVWFREGLAEYLERPSHSSGAQTLTEDDNLRQRSDSRAARAAYTAATQRVTMLAGRYGADAVLTWLTRGLPPELNNPSSSQAATKRR